MTRDPLCETRTTHLHKRIAEKLISKHSSAKSIRPFPMLVIRFCAPLICCVFLMTSLPTPWPFLLTSFAALGTAIIAVQDSCEYTPLDISIAAYYLSSIVSTLGAYEVSTALPQFVIRTVFALLYLLCRIDAVRSSDLVVAGISGITVHSSLAILTFFKSYHIWKSLAFPTTSLIAFRAFVTLTSAGVRSGDGAVIYLVGIALSGYGLATCGINRTYQLLCLLCLTVSTFAIVVSFSRGLYLSAAIVGLGVILPQVHGAPLRKSTLLLLLSVGFVLFAGSIVFLRPIAIASSRIILINEDMSQSRSLGGRIEIEKAALRVAMHSGVFGTGISNYPLAVRRSGALGAVTKTSHPFNIWLQTTIEQGFVGLIALTSVAITLLLQICKIARRPGSVSVIVGLFGLAVFSCCQSFLVADEAVAASLAILCGISVSGSNSRE